MDVVTAALSIILLFLLYIMTRPDAETSRMKRLLNKMPGPPALPIFGTAWELITSPLKRHAEIFTKYDRKYGPIYRGWVGSRGVVTVSCPEAIETILSSTVHVNHTAEYLAFIPWLGDCLLMKRGQEWRKLRKLCSPAFSTGLLDIYFEIFKNNAETLVQTLRRKVSAGEFDICHNMTLYTLDSIFETGFGFKLNAQKNNNTAYANALEVVVKGVAEMIHHPWTFWKHMVDPSGIRKRFGESLTFCHTFVDTVFGIRIGDEDGIMKNDIDLRLNDMQVSEVQETNRDTLGLLINVLGKEVTKKNIQALIFAGHDTTTSGLCWAIQLLGEHTDVQDKVYEEMTSIFEGSDRRPTKEDIDKMKYLDRVIKETLRLYPSISAVSRLTETDIQIGQYKIPAGVSICIHIYSLHRNPKYYPNPEEFNPDNFLPERVRDRHPYAYIPFSAGPRSCLGQRYAIMEMKTALSSMIRNFKIKSINRTKDLLPVFGATVSVNGGVHVELTLRDKM